MSNNGPIAVLSNEEKVNLLKLSMKADGLGNDLVANGQLDSAAINAARVFLKHADTRKRLGTQAAPMAYVVSAVLEKICPTKKTAWNVSEESIKDFFAEHGIIL